MDELRKMSRLSGIRERRDLEKNNALTSTEHLVLYMIQCLLNTLFTILGTLVDITVIKEAGMFTHGGLKDDRASTVELLVKEQNISHL